MEERTKDGYRFGYNGQEKDNEITGKGNHNTALFWEYDTRVARRWNVDPVYKHGLSNYATFANNPLIYADPNGLDSINVIRNMTSYTNHDGMEVPGSSSENMNIVKGEGKDVFTFTVSHKVYRQNGDLDRTETTRQTLDVNSYDYNSLYGHAYRIILDGLFTPEISMTGKETVGQWMNQNPDFAQYMIARNPESSYWQTGIKTNLAYGGSGLGQAITWGAAGQMLSLGSTKAINPFGARGGYGIFGENCLKLGNYRLDLMYANPAAGEGAGTIFSLKQIKNGVPFGAGIMECFIQLERWDYIPR